MNQVLLSLEREASANAFLLCLLFSLLALWLIKSNKLGTTKYMLPPSPSKLPFIGNLHQLHGSPQHAFRSLAKKHGPLMLLRLGHVPTLVVSSAEAARDVMKTYDHIFSNRPELMIPKRLLYSGKDIAFAPYGDYWRQIRKICVLQLLSAKKVQSFRFVREQETTLLVEEIKESSLSNSPVNLSKMFVSLASNIICMVCFGRKYNEGEDGRKFIVIFKELADLFGVSNLGDLIPSLAWVNHVNGLNARVEKNFRDLDAFFDQVIGDHIDKKIRSDAGGENEEEEEDIVDVMLGVEKDSTLGIPVTRDSTKAVILDLFSGGTDTSSGVLEWSMSELLRHPEIMEKIQKEVRDIAKGKLILMESDTKEMHYLRSVIKETLRLHPPAPLLVPRESIENVQIQGYDIPSKTAVMINAFAIGRDPMLWEEPEEFWPERFLNGPNASLDFKGQDMKYIPFGSGRRGCPGILFGTSIVELALANLINRFNWSLPNGRDSKDLDMEEGDSATVHRKNDLVLVAHPHY